MEKDHACHEIVIVGQGHAYKLSVFPIIDPLARSSLCSLHPLKAAKRLARGVCHYLNK